MESLLYTIKDIQMLTQWNPSTIYRKIAKKEFPAPIKIGYSSRWPKEYFDAWRAQLIEENQTQR